MPSAVLYLQIKKILQWYHFSPPLFSEYIWEHLALSGQLFLASNIAWAKAGATWIFSTQACIYCLLQKWPCVLERTYCPCSACNEAEKTKLHGTGMMNSLNSRLALLNIREYKTVILCVFKYNSWVILSYYIPFCTDIYEKSYCNLSGLFLLWLLLRVENCIFSWLQSAWCFSQLPCSAQMWASDSGSQMYHCFDTCDFGSESVWDSGVLGASC